MSQDQAEYLVARQPGTKRFEISKYAHFQLNEQAVGCYILWKDETAVYVGQSMNIFDRVASHQSTNNPIWFDGITVLKFSDYPEFMNLNDMEASLIVRCQSTMNKKLPNNTLFVNIDRTYMFKINSGKARNIIKKSGIQPVMAMPCGRIFLRRDLEALGILRDVPGKRMEGVKEVGV